MINDATVICECDECGLTEEASPEYKYTSFGGGGGHYDCDDDSIMALPEMKGWTLEDERLLCEDCSKEGGE